MSTTESEVHKEAIRPFQGSRELKGIRTYRDFLAAQNTVKTLKLKAKIRRKIHNIRDSEESNVIYSIEGQKKYTFERTYKAATQAFIYRKLILFQSRDHPYQVKWIEDGNLRGAMSWDKTWEYIHKQLHIEEVTPHTTTINGTKRCNYALCVTKFLRIYSTSF